MLSRKELEIVLHYPRIVTRYRLPMGVRMRSDEGRQLVVVQRSTVANLVYFGYLALGAYLTAHAGYRLRDWRDFGLELQILYLAIFACLLTAYLCNLGFALWRLELANLFNVLVSLNGQVKEEQGGTRDSTGVDKREKLVGFFYKTLKVLIFCGCGSTFPAVEFMYAWSTRTCEGSCGLAFPCLQAALVLFFVVCCYPVCGQLQMIPFLYFVLVGDTLRQRQVRRDWQGLVMYRTLSIVCTLFNQSFGMAAVPVLKFLLSVALMGSLVGAIRLPITGATSVLVNLGLLGIGLYYLVFLVLGADIGTTLWVKSTAYVWKWGHDHESEEEPRSSTESRKYIQLAAESMSPIRFGVAGMYYLERHAKMTFLNFLLNGILTMLIAFK